jgi:uncharacterized OB-fold protein
MEDSSGAQDGSWDLGPSATYVEGLRQGALRFLRCDACHQAIFFPRVLCPHCGSSALHWEESGGDGVVYSVTEIAPSERDPYNIVLIDLDDGFRILSTVLDSTPTIGMRVRFAREESSVEFSEAGPRPVFRALDESPA